MSTRTTELQTLTGSYAIDPAHSRIGFAVRHAMVAKVRGSFDEFEGSGWFDAGNPADSRFSLTIKTASIDTGNADRDAHLRTNDFFDMERHPEIAFVLTAVEPLGRDRYRVTGDLTIKGITRSVTADVEFNGAAVDPYGNLRLGFEGSTTVNRKDFGLTWNVALETGGVLVGEKVVVEFDIAAIKTG